MSHDSAQAGPRSPADRSDLDQIPKGHTCQGVHRAIVEHLLSEGNDLDGSHILDIPCGQGELIRTLRRYFPGARVKGCDLEKPKSLKHEDFTVVDANHSFRTFPEQRFDYILCVSGVMEFDNTRQFFESCRAHLRGDGALIVTNDNFVSIRDRLAYFWLGKTRQYPLFVVPDQPTWKMISIQNLVRILHDAGFEIEDIRYVSMKSSDWITLPLAVFIYAIQLVHVRLSRTTMPLTERRRLFPFASLLCRHFIVFAKVGARCEK